MPRYVDVEKLKRKLIEGDGDDEFTEGYNSAINDIIGYIDNMPVADVEPDESWIRVEDRLPENETKVLIYCPEFVSTIKLAMWIEDSFYVEKEDLIVKAEPNGYCTHWQPLPEPPKDDEIPDNEFIGGF